MCALSSVDHCLYKADFQGDVHRRHWTNHFAIHCESLILIQFEQPSPPEMSQNLVDCVNHFQNEKKSYRMHASRFPNFGRHFRHLMSCWRSCANRFPNFGRHFRHLMNCWRSCANRWTNWQSQRNCWPMNENRSQSFVTKTQILLSYLPSYGNHLMSFEIPMKNLIQTNCQRKRVNHLNCWLKPNLTQ